VQDESPIILAVLCTATLAACCAAPVATARAFICTHAVFYAPHALHGLVLITSSAPVWELLALVDAQLDTQL
jgi:hypothetical protein